MTSFNFYHRYYPDFGVGHRYYPDLWVDEIKLYIFLAIVCFLIINLIYLFSFQSIKVFKISTISTFFILLIFIFDNPEIINFYIEKQENFIINYYDLKNFYYFISNLYSLNPYSKIPFYISNGLFLQLPLLFLSSLILIKFLFQITLSFINVNFKFQQNMQLFYSIFFVISLYSLSKVPMDIRVFLSCLTPFFIYFNEKLLSKYYLILINLILILISFIAILI